MLASLGLLLALAAPAAADPVWRLRAEPQDTAEAALRDASSSAGPGAADALVAVAQRFPGSATSGLAHLAAGLRLLDAGRPADAVPQLTHPDVQATLVRDHALHALGRAQEALGQIDAAARSYLAAGSDPAAAVTCAALPKAAELFLREAQPAAAVPALEAGRRVVPTRVPRRPARPR